MIDLDGHDNPIAICFQILKASIDEGLKFFPFTFDTRSHGTHVIFEPTCFDDIHGSGHIGAQAVTFIHRKNRKIGVFRRLRIYFE